MPRTYAPGADADAIVDRLLAKGCYATGDEVVRAGLQLLQKHDAAREELLRLGGEVVAGARGPADCSKDAAR